MANITARRTMHFGSGGNEFLEYALNEIKRRSLILSNEAFSDLEILFQRSNKKANEGVKRRKRNNPNRIFTRLKDKTLGNQFTVGEYYKNIRKLVSEISDFTIKNDTEIISSLDIRKALEKLCPIWPFC